MKLYKFENILNEIASTFDMDQWDEQVDLFTDVIKEQLDYFIYLNSYPYPLKIFGGISHAEFYGKNNIYVNNKHVELDKGYLRLSQEFANIDKINVIIKDLNKTIATHTSQLNRANSNFKSAYDPVEWGCCNMFGSCRYLYSVPRFDTSGVNTMKYMFYDCISLVSVPLFNTSSVTDMDNMFCDCPSLSEKTKKEWSSVYDFEKDEMK